MAAVRNYVLRRCPVFLIIMRCFSIILLFLSAFLSLSAQTVDSVAVYSPAMQRDVKNVIILPEDYDTAKQYPVLYLLHGYSKNEQVWLEIRPDLPRLASFHDMIIVCPDGRNSWYFNSPVDSTSRYETYLSKELPQYMDSHYSTRANPQGRAITGFSMGGHGALYTAMRHQDVFGACGSTSGGVDFRPFPEMWEIKDVLGEYYTAPQVWDENTVMAQLPLVKSSLAIIFDCGNEDFFHDVNERLHKEMEYRRIKHDYTCRPGIHDFNYWNLSIPHHLQFFDEYFNGKNTYEMKIRYTND